MGKKENMQKMRAEIVTKRDNSKTFGEHLYYKMIGNIVGAPKEETLPLSPNRNTNKTIILEDLVDEYIAWYSEIIKGEYTNIGEYCEPMSMRNFIEKMAVWYELRYPDYEINRLIHCAGEESSYIDKVMFEDNAYVQDLLCQENEVKYLEWSYFYNYEAFYNSLSSTEKSYLEYPEYPSMLYIKDGGGHIHLDGHGLIKEADGISFLSNFKNQSNQMYIDDLVAYMVNNKLAINPDNEILSAYNSHQRYMYQRQGMLECVLYRIIARGENRYGPRRGLLFAKEFNLNLAIPMIYGVDTSDPGLRSFINEYIKAGGSMDITCYVNYFSRSSKYEERNKISLEQLLKTTPADCLNKYTREEKDLQQRLTNIIAYLRDTKSSDKPPILKK